MMLQFETQAAHYATVTSPGETVRFEWDADTGAPSQFEWLHGEAVWYLHPDTPGSITRENPNVKYYDVDLLVTTEGHHATPNALKGKITVDVPAGPDAATFAAIMEGTGSAWFVADGTLTTSDL